MSRLASLPRLMLAPNGARLRRADHPALPVSVVQIVDTARACHAAGAGALHAHVRDGAGRHVLDAGLYASLIEQMAQAVPDMPVQITTEAAGRYTPAQQMALVRRLRPEGVSIALSELAPDDAAARLAAPFYSWAAQAGIEVQHILYHADDLARLLDLHGAGLVPGPGSRAGQGPLQMLFVLGRYGAHAARPDDLAPFLAVLHARAAQADWAACAFGPHESACLLAAARAGGKLRVGFENNLVNADGSLARDNAERVSEVMHALGQAGL